MKIASFDVAVSRLYLLAREKTLGQFSGLGDPQILRNYGNQSNISISIPPSFSH